jgi:hypothetical protein
MTNKKKMVTVKIGTPYLSQGWSNYKSIDYNDTVTFDPEGSIDYLIGQLRSIEDEYSSRYVNIQLVSKINQYDDDRTYFAYGTREETDLEFEFRIEKEERDLNAQRDRDLRQLEELKKKYG